MREAPANPRDDVVLATVREHWLHGADEVRHLPVGFGAWHWQVLALGRPRLFATLDPLGVHHTLDSLEAAYAGAAELARLNLTRTGTTRCGNRAAKLRRLSC